MFGGRKRTCRRGGKTHRRKAHRGGRKSCRRSRRGGGRTGQAVASVATGLWD